jgi:hypothetical protein
MDRVQKSSDSEQLSSWAATVIITGARPRYKKARQVQRTDYRHKDSVKWYKWLTLQRVQFAERCRRLDHVQGTVWVASERRTGGAGAKTPWSHWPADSVDPWPCSSCLRPRWPRKTGTCCTRSTAIKRVRESSSHTKSCADSYPGTLLTREEVPQCRLWILTADTSNPRRSTPM